MKKLFPLTIFTLIFALSGCGDSACYNKLKEVDSLSENTTNDSAQKALETIEQTYKIKDGKDRAYYSLLKYQLQFRFQYNNRNYVVDEELIDYSIAYYKKYNDNHKLALCYYLKGRTKDNLSQSKEAIKYFKEAEFAIRDIDDNYLKMRIYDCIATINCRQENYSFACEYDRKAIRCGEKTNKLETLIWCYLRLSGIYENLDSPDSCLFYATKCIKYLNDAPDEQKSTIYLNVAGAIEDIDTINAKEYALKSLEIRKSNNAYQILAKIARDNKDYKLSEAYLNEALKYSPSLDWDAFILYELANTKTLMGEHEGAARI